MVLDFWGQRKGERDRDRERHWCRFSYMPLTWDRTHNPDLCPDLKLNSWPLGLQDNPPTNWSTLARAETLYSSRGKKWSISSNRNNQIDALKLSQNMQCNGEMTLWNRSEDVTVFTRPLHSTNPCVQVPDKPLLTLTKPCKWAFYPGSTDRESEIQSRLKWYSESGWQAVAAEIVLFSCRIRFSPFIFSLED